VPRPSRRAVLIGAGLGLLLAAGGTSYELIEAGTLPGKYALADLDGACGSAPLPPRGALAAWHAVSFYSRYRHRQVQLVTLIPAGAADPGRGAAGASRGAAAGALRVLIALHGSGSDAAALARRVAPAMTAARLTGVAVLCVDGGDTYWHKRADGDDPVGMIVHEVLPRAAAAGLATARVALLGESMGGYGALLLAERSPLRRGGAGCPRRPLLPRCRRPSSAVTPTLWRRTTRRSTARLTSAPMTSWPTRLPCATFPPGSPAEGTIRSSRRLLTSALAWLS
jgi:Putative esterase